MSLFGNFIKWVVLTIVTFGIYIFWLQNAKYRWVIKNTRFADNSDQTKESQFTGGVLDLALTNITAFLLIIFTLGIGLPWAITSKHRWRDRHTYIEGQKLRFIGSGPGLIGNYIKWILLTIITLGIYSLWLNIKVKQWVIKNRIFDERNAGAQEIDNKKPINLFLIAGPIAILFLVISTYFLFGVVVMLFSLLASIIAIAMYVLSKSDTKDRRVWRNILQGAFFLVLSPTVYFIDFSVQTGPKPYIILSKIVIIISFLLVIGLAPMLALQNKEAYEKVKDAKYNSVDLLALEIGIVMVVSGFLYLVKSSGLPSVDNGIERLIFNEIVWIILIINPLIPSRKIKEMSYYLIALGGISAIFSVVKQILFIIKLPSYALTPEGVILYFTFFISSLSYVFLGIYLVFKISVGKDFWKFTFYIINFVITTVLILVGPDTMAALVLYYQSFGLTKSILDITLSIGIPNEFTAIVLNGVLPIVMVTVLSLVFRKRNNSEETLEKTV